MEAQRYPNDFDDIIAGAPAFDWTGFEDSQLVSAFMDATNPDLSALKNRGSKLILARSWLPTTLRRSGPAQDNQKNL